MPPVKSRSPMGAMAGPTSPCPALQIAELFVTSTTVTTVTVTAVTHRTGEAAGGGGAEGGAGGMWGPWGGESCSPQI